MIDNKNKIKTEHDIYDYYNELYQFLGQFALDADFDKFDNEETIKEYNFYSDDEYKRYQIILPQANEILAMEPFPFEAIQTATNLFISKASDENKKSEEVKQWLRNVLHLLELQVTGKL